jgi:hypothetical protein
MKPTALTHNLFSQLLNNQVESDFGILTARDSGQITWQWHKPAIWGQRTSDHCLQIHNEERTLLQWSNSEPNQTKEIVNQKLLKEVLAQRHLIVSLIGHGSGIDVDLSGVGILCGRTKEALKAASRDRTAPFCAIDGVKCHRNRAGLRELVEADSIQAAVLFVNSCRSVALSHSAYSMNLSLALGVMDGPTVALLSPHTVRATSLDENVFAESCVQAGMSLGVIASRLNELVRDRGELPPFLLIGRPDFRPVPAEKINKLQWSKIKRDGYEVPATSIPLLRITGASRHDSTYTHVDNVGDFQGENSQFCTQIGKELWIYGNNRDSSSILKVDDSDWQSEEKMFKRLWAALQYWEMLHPLFAQEYSEELLSKTEAEFRTLRDLLVEGVPNVGPIGRRKNSRLGKFALTHIQDQVQSAVNSLSFILADLLDRRGNMFLIEHLAPKMETRSTTSSQMCGCGAALSSWHLKSLLSADVLREQLRCPSCGIVYDSPYQQGKLEYFGTDEIRGGETIKGGWLWQPSAEIMGPPLVHLAIYHSACDPRRFKLMSTITTSNPDGSFAFAHTLRARKSVIPETYWIAFTVLANLEISYAMQRLRVFRR